MTLQQRKILERSYCIFEICTIAEVTARKVYYTIKKESRKEILKCIRISDTDNLIEENYCTKSRSVIFASLVVLSLIAASTMMTGTIIQPFQQINGQNATGQNASEQMENASDIDQVEIDVLESLAAPGYASTYDVMVDGQSTPISYNMIGGQLVGMLANPDRHALYIALNPHSDGGAIEVQLPRDVIDSKTSQNTDKPYTVVMDGDRISGEPTGVCIGDCPNIFNSFSQTAESSTERVLTIVFGPDSRFIEIIGDRGA
jgi:hypothetical protein